MTYTIVPNSGQSLGVTRNPINTNFSLIQSVFNTNHVHFNNTGAGKHLLIQMPTVQTASPGTAAGEIALYTRNVSGVPELFFQPESTAPAGNDIQLTANITPAIITPTYNPATVGGQPVTGNAFVTFLPGNIIMVAGVVTGNNGASGLQKITFPFNITTAWSITITRFTLTGGSRSTHIITNVTAVPASFTVNSVDFSGNTVDGFKYYYNMVATLA